MSDGTAGGGAPQQQPPGGPDWQFAADASRPPEWGPPPGQAPNPARSTGALPPPDPDTAVSATAVPPTPEPNTTPYGAAVPPTAAAGWPSTGAHAPAPVDEVLFTVGDMAVSRYWIVTPTGAVPLAGTRWVCRDNTITQRVMPGYAVVLCVIFLLVCLLGLLALAIREDRTTGAMEVTVTGPDGFFHLVSIPVTSSTQVASVRQAVSHAQALAGQPRV